jgi:hypothetical protein
MSGRSYRCVYGSPACAGLSFKSPVGARQHWSCLPGSIFSAVVTGLGRSTPDLREDDRVVLASVAGWAVVGAIPALASSIAAEALDAEISDDEIARTLQAALQTTLGGDISPEMAEGEPAPDGETTRALQAALQTTLGAEIPIQIEEAGRALFDHSSGRTVGIPQTRLVLGITELQLKAVTAVAKELLGDPSAQRYVAQHLGAKAQEAFWVVPVDAGGQARSIVEVAVGHYHSVGVPIPAVLGAVMLAGTDLFWVAHNHPSGETEPSKSDVELTKQLAVAARVMELHLVDHLIVGPGASSLSLVQLGRYEADWGELSDEGHGRA